MTNLDHAPTGRGTIFIFRSEFLSYRGRGSLDVPADERLFARRNFPCPAIGLSWLDSVFVGARTPPTARSKSVLSTHDKGRRVRSRSFFR